MARSRRCLQGLQAGREWEHRDIIQYSAANSNSAWQELTEGVHCRGWAAYAAGLSKYQYINFRILRLHMPMWRGAVAGCWGGCLWYWIVLFTRCHYKPPFLKSNSQLAAVGLLSQYYSPEYDYIIRPTIRSK